MADVTFITLTWNSQAYIRGCLDSILWRTASDGLEPRIIVVDNGSSDRTLDIVNEFGRSHASTLTVIAFESNRGTTLPRNVALRQARSAYVCILDSDTEFVSGSLRPALAMLEADDRIALVAPRLVLPDGSTQHSVKRFPTFLDKVRKIPRILLGLDVPRTDFYPSFPFGSCTRVETAISACWLLRTDLLQSIGLLDEAIFYAPEDLDYSARIREAGLDIVYDPRLTLLHHTQQISHRRPLSRISLSHLEGLIRYHRKHGGWFTRPDGLAAPHRPPGGLAGEAMTAPTRRASVS